MVQLHGRSVLITGASSGIGAALALMAGRAGARVALLARTRPALEEAAAAIRAEGGAAFVCPVDLTDAQATEAAVRASLAALGTPDIVISNAGAGRWLTVEETPPEEAVAMMAMPYFAAFYLTRALLPAMLARGVGRLAYVNSPASLAAWPGAVGYTAARWALRGFAEALRADLRGTGLHVTTVIPGLVRSPYFANNPGAEERVPWLARLMRPLTPEEAARATLRAVLRGEREAVFPGMLRALYVANALAPWLVRRLLASTGWRRPT
jgi:short-subunit dehydrogenase